MEDEAAHAVTIAEAKVSEISARIEQAKEEAARNRAKARELAFQALDDDSAKRLATKLLGDAQRLEDDVAYRLMPALDEAKRRVTAARAAAAKADARRRAERDRQCADRVRARLRDVAEHLRCAAENLRAARPDLDELVRSGALSGAQVSANIDYALDTAVHNLHPKRIRAVLLRRYFDELGAAWFAHVDLHSALALGEPAPDAQGGALAALEPVGGVTEPSPAEAVPEPSESQGDAVEAA